MNFLSYFAVAFSFSALGALPPGLINLAVAERTIRKNIRAGVVVSVGATLIEFLYTFIAIYFIDFFIRNVMVSNAIKIAAIVILFSLAVYYYFKKPVTIGSKTKAGSATRDFGLGLGTASMNMLILPYWIFLGMWLPANGFPLSGVSFILVLALGSAIGAFIVFLLYVRLGNYIVNNVEKVALYMHKTLSVLFFALGIIQLSRLLIENA